MTRLAPFVTLALVGVLGCANKVVPITVTVLTKKCVFADGGSPGPNPTDGVDHYQAVITGPDIDPITQTFAAGAAVPLDQIPPGSARVLTLTGYAGDPNGDGAVVKAFGQSAPFDVPDDGDATVGVKVLLKAAGVFAGVPTIADPTQCASLAVPRAGHTATLLADGRVLIAGGFSIRDGGLPLDGGGLDPSKWTYHNEAEIFDPATNTTSAVAAMTAFNTSATGYDSPSAFHAASLLPSGKVLISGGEVYGGGSLSARNNTMLFDPTDDSWMVGVMYAAEYRLSDGGRRLISRSHHASMVDGSGRVVLAGGVSYAQNSSVPQVVPEVLWADGSEGGTLQVDGHPDTDILLRAAIYEDGGLAQTSRTNQGSSSVLGGGAVAVAGGDALDAGYAYPLALYFQYSPALQGMKALELGGNPDVAPARSHAALTVLGPEQSLVVVAGGTGEDGGLLNASAVLDSTAGGTQFALSNSARGRNDPCAVTLPNGQALVAGGQLLSGKTSNLADLYTESFYWHDPARSISDGGATVAPIDVNMIASRVFHTCTVLQDGSVLITGGLNVENGRVSVLDSMELYTPVGK